MTAQLAYDHIADFIAAVNPAKVLELHAPEAARLRLEELIELEKVQELSPSKKDELDHFIVLELLKRFVLRGLLRSIPIRLKAPQQCLLSFSSNLTTLKK